jgi:hypothetical protein
MSDWCPLSRADLAERRSAYRGADEFCLKSSHELPKGQFWEAANSLNY